MREFMTMRKQDKRQFNRRCVVRSVGALLLLLLTLFSLIGCRSNRADNGATERTKIVVGIDKYQPYSYLALDGSYTGIDVELATLVFHRLGYEPDFQLIAWQEKNDLLADGSIDCIWSCYSMDGREDLYQWAGPYLNSPQVIAVRADSNIYTFDDLADQRVGVQATTRAAELFLHDIDSELPQVYRVNIFATTDDMFAAIRKGYVDAIAGHEALINELVREGDGAYRLLDKSPKISKAGVAFQKGTHVELAQEINALFEEFTADGTIARIVEKYGLDVNFSVIGGGDEA